MARCSDCRKRLFPLFNSGVCGSCGEVRRRADEEKRYQQACRRRDELNAHGLLPRAARGAVYGALVGLGFVLVFAIGVLSALGERGESPAPQNRLQWIYFGWWVLLSGAVIGALYLAGQPRPLLFVVPPVVALVLGAQFGARRAVRRDWSWWLNLDTPAHLSAPNR